MTIGRPQSWHRWTIAVAHVVARNLDGESLFLVIMEHHIHHNFTVSRHNSFRRTVAQTVAQTSVSFRRNSRITISGDLQRWLYSVGFGLNNKLFKLGCLEKLEILFVEHVHVPASFYTKMQMKAFD